MKYVPLLTALAFALATISAPATPTLDEQAKFVAGVPVKDAALAARQKEPWYGSYSAELDKKWVKMDHRQLAHVRDWATGNPAVAKVSGTVYYMFSGPDFLYPRTLFPNASTYILCGTEPVGTVPDITQMPPNYVAADLSNLRHSLDSMLTTHYFITKDMRVDLTRGNISGTLPLLYVFLEKSGCTINSVNYNGPSVEIKFHSPAGKSQTLFYFKTDLSNGGGNSSFLAFCKQQGPGASLLKSASYLMHTDGFSTIRNFLLANSTLIIQDDSGLAFRAYDQRRWNVKLYGVYNSTLPMFQQYYQPDLAKAFETSKPGSLGFAFGYHWQVPMGVLIEATPH